jgi:hypothetical protein
MDPEISGGPLTGAATVTGRVARAWRAFQEFLAGQRELQERLLLINRPWEEELLHWGPDGELHGHLAPPADGRRRSVTQDGWCPGARRAAPAGSAPRRL